ncbi:hypothetical protein FRB95_005821 [Tulasnella sp. JGI-2019a]|nr:hypothetical protein FRB95_005821 [Tulasnella sp. JGI-2019a]
MAHTDKQPIKNTPWTAKIVQHNPNRFGAVLSAVYGFWNSRNSDFRRDSYSVILFNSSPQTLINHDVTSTPDELLDRIVSIQPTGGTDFNAALESAKSLMETHWSTDRSPVFIFLSDGEGGLSDYIVRDICQRAAIRQKPLSLHAVSFASATIDLFQMVRASLDRTRSGSLRRMVAIAEGVVQGAPRNPPSPVAECTYTDAIDTIRLAETFLDISRSLKKSRAALIPTNRRQPTNYRLITLFSPRSLPYAQGQGKGFRGDEIETIRV